MTQLTALLELRNKIKNKKPVFIRQDNPKRPKLSDKWRKPKGIHSKIRHHFKGRRKMPSPGYKSPVNVRGLHATGLQMLRVHSPEEVAGLKKDSQGAIIPKTIGKRKRIEILKKAKELNITILNLNIDEQIKRIEDFINSKKGKSIAKDVKKDEIKEPKKVKEKTIQELTGEQKKEIEKKEKDKVLTKKV